MGPWQGSERTAYSLMPKTPPCCLVRPRLEGVRREGRSGRDSIASLVSLASNEVRLFGDDISNTQSKGVGRAQLVEIIEIRFVTLLDEERLCSPQLFYDNEVVVC